MPAAGRGQKEMLDSPELDLGMVVKYIVATGNQPGSSRRTASALNHESVPSALMFVTL